MITERTTRIGERAPDLDLDTPDGGKLTLDSLEAERTLLIFQRHLG